MVEPVRFAEPQRYVFETPVGEIWLWGDEQALSCAKPVVLFLSGAFAMARPRSFELPELLPQAAVFNAHLPGTHCPELTSQTLATFATGYASALMQIGRPAIMIGGSVGALVAMTMTADVIRGQVLIEPPLRTDKLWCLLPALQAKLAEAPNDKGLADFLWDVFGCAESSLEPRDYRPLVAGISCPTWAMFGGEPLQPPRSLTELPSLVDEPERELLGSHPLVKTRIVPTVGHNVPGRAIQFVRTAARDLLERTMGGPHTATAQA